MQSRPFTTVPPVSTQSEQSASGPGGPPLVQSPRAKSPSRGTDPVAD